MDGNFGGGSTSARFTLGIDVSTQSISSSILDTDSGTVSHQVSLSYRDDPRLNRFGIDFDSLIVPPRWEGEADQPPRMFLAALDALFAELKRSDAPLSELSAVAVSAQQHGHVYLNSRAAEQIAGLGGTGVTRGTGSPPETDRDLAALLTEIFAYGTAPIWQTADTQREASEIRERIGGREEMINLSGSDSPLRFTGAVIRRRGRRFPEIYERTERISLLSTFISAVLSGNPETPTDWGNGSGMSLMDYRRKIWSGRLVDATARDLPGGSTALKRKLPSLAPPTEIAGSIARYFVERYGINPECLVTIGSGDNPQTKTLSSGDLLSLGSSFVYMVDTNEPVVDLQGFANSMYDGIGRPFIFACRTNGALVWDRVRKAYGADFNTADAALTGTSPGSRVEIWQPWMESYPLSPVIPNVRAERGEGSFPEVYAAIVDSTLTLVRHFAGGFDRRTSGTGARPVINSGVDTEPLAVTGGPSAGIPVLQRVADIWNRPVYSVGSAGAAVGSAFSAWTAYCRAKGIEVDIDELRNRILPPGSMIHPNPGNAEAVSERSSYIRELTEAINSQ